ncbi:MAG: hypothetical protein ABUS56_08600 [Acidobacteriota bacterium]
MTKRSDLHASPAGLHHEPDDVSLRALLGNALGLVVVTAVFAALAWVLFAYLLHREAARVTPVLPLAAGQEHRIPPEPRLQSHPREDLRELQAEEARILDSYGWVDREAGIVRIPIDEAMKLTVERGLPARTPEAPHDVH